MSTLILKGGNGLLDAGSDYSDHAAKGSDKDLDITGFGLVGCHFPILSSFFTVHV